MAGRESRRSELPISPLFFSTEKSLPLPVTSPIKDKFFSISQKRLSDPRVEESMVMVTTNLKSASKLHRRTMITKQK